LFGKKKVLVVIVIINCLQWLIDHPTFLSNEVYIGGDSYSGIPIPVIVQEISQGKKKLYALQNGGSTNHR